MDREEAIETIRKNMPSDKSLPVYEALQTLVPELAESEDEKMINELQGFLDSFGADYFGTGKWQKFHDWLEKREEPHWCHHRVDLSNCSEEYMKAYYDGWNNCNQQHSQYEAEQKPMEKPVIQEKNNEVMKAIEDIIRVYGKTQGEWIAGYGMDTLVVHLRKAFAALEKQKEHHLELYYDKELDNAAREFYLSGGADSPVDSTGLVPIVRMAEFGATWMKERMEKEQKPCWNPTEEDVALFNKAITTNASLSPQERAKLDILRMKFKHRPVIEQKEQKSEDLPAGFYVTFPDGKKYYTKEMRCNNMNVKVVAPKPAEWSKEDKSFYNSIVCEVIKEGMHPTPEQAKWFKSLPERFSLQPKKELSIKKAIQWLDDTFYFLDNSSGRGRDCEITTHDFDSLEEMYDSFRKAVTVDSEPHWKPSEEQMGAVKHAYNSFPNDCSTKSNLKLLYHDLEKLM